MRKAKEIIGLPVLTFRNPRKVGEVHDILFDPARNRVLAFLVDEGGWFDTAKVIPFDRVHSVGDDAIIIEDERDIVPADRNREIQRALQSDRVVTHLRVFTEDGRDLGSIGDMFVNERTGEVSGYEVSGGFLATTLRGKQFMPAPETLSMGRDVAFVPSETGDKMERQVTGGIQAGVRGVSGVARQVTESVQEQTKRLTSASVEQQMRYVEGKRTGSTVTADGRVIVRANETVTRRDAEQADRAGVLAQLVGAVVSGQAQETGGQVSEQARGAAGRAGGAAQAGAQPLQQGANTALDDIRNAINSLTQTTEQQLINAALGRPVTRVILDKNDDIILNTGDIITHEAIRMARDAGVLEVLLSSASSEKPKLEPDVWYAPEEGEASLESEHPELQMRKERPEHKMPPAQRMQTEQKTQPEHRMHAGHKERSQQRMQSEPKERPEKRM